MSKSGHDKNRNSGPDPDVPGGRWLHDDLLEEVHRLRHRFQDDPSEAHAAEVYGASGDRHLREMLELAVREKQVEQQRLQDPFYPDYPPKGEQLTDEPPIAVGQLPVGGALPLPASRMPSGLGIIGANGMGKSTLAKWIVCQLMNRPPADRPIIVVFDHKGTWWDITRWPKMAEKTARVRLSELFISPLQPPPNVPTRAWVSAFVETLASSYGLLSAHRFLQQRAMEALAECPPECAPTLSHILEKNNAYRPRPGGIEVRYKESAGNILNKLLCATELFECIHSNVLERLFADPRLILIENDHLLDEGDAGFVIDVICQWLYRYRWYNPSARSHMAQVVLEDIMPQVTETQSERSPGGTTALDRLAAVGREFNVSLTIVTHMFANISSALIRNLENLVGVVPRRDNDFELQQKFNIDRPRVQAVKESGRGSAIASIPQVWPLSVMVNFPPPPQTQAAAPALSDQLRSELKVQHSVAETPTKPSKTTRDTDNGAQGASHSQNDATTANNHREAKTTSNDTPKRASPTQNQPRSNGGQYETYIPQLLVALAVKVPPTQEVLFKHLGVSRPKGSRIVRDAENKGLVRGHMIQRSKRGGRQKRLFLTEEGRAFLRDRGIQPPQHEANGHPLHNAVVVASDFLFRRDKHQTKFEVKVGNNLVDLQAISPNGRITYVQVGVSDFRREAKNAANIIANLPDSDSRLLMICLDRKFERGFCNHLREEVSAELVRARVETRLLGDVLERYHA